MNGAQKLAFINCKYDPSTISTIQTISGNGALSLAFDFIYQNHKKLSAVYLSSPTWSGHLSVIKKSGI